MEEQYIKILPLKNADHKRISRNKRNPLQRIKVSSSTPLFSISNYVQQLANVDPNNVSVLLYAPRTNSCIQLPLSLSISEYRLITEQEEIRYSFVDKDKESKNEKKPKNKVQLINNHPSLQITKIQPKPTQEPHYPLPPVTQIFSNSQNSNFFTNIGVPLLDSQSPLFHTGFSLFSCSFGMTPHSNDSQTLQIAERDKETTNENISLKKGIEQFLRKDS
ncbi:hypothetical protein GPJ56_002845 [Histomonas meleagridis]|uniref:uncharacterized protein n=1 Tax=Histomonas meleagridis TaxID=135588 RepID=UPI003559FC92|nr:hypothetical protein GPJ56_002845 [Histomonas meleagridis]KAH0806361.1 hypothetical protein GO595_001049 [Histomonas meleagridis]